MNKRLEHEGIENRFPQEQHSGPIAPGVGFPGQGGGGVVRRIVEIDGVKRAVDLRPAEEWPAVNQVTHCFDSEKKHLGVAEHLNMGEWYIKGEQVEDVAYWCEV